MLYRLRRTAQRWRFDRAAAGILRTAPMPSMPVAAQPGTPLRIVSMLNIEHLRAYLVAAKGLLFQLGRPAEMHVIDDGSLGADDRQTLRDHLPGVVVTTISEIETGPCPAGGAWERLLHILDLSATSYVVQVDSDVLCTAPPTEVAEAVAANRAFTLGTAPDFDVEDRAASAARVSEAARTPGSHIQAASEAELADLPPPFGRLYIRGSAGFAGFARGGPGRTLADAFSVAMEARLGRRWTEWGTEQVTSNFLIANSPGGHVLPWARYACFYGRAVRPMPVLLHFIGAWRFERGEYAKLARSVVASLPRA